MLTPEQRKYTLTLVRSIRKRRTDTKPTTESEPTTSETPSNPKSPVESKDLHPDTPLFSERRDTPSPVHPPSDNTDSGPSLDYSEVTPHHPVQEALQVQTLPPQGIIVLIELPVLFPPWGL